MKPEIILFSNIVEKNGKTIKENNTAIQHKVPIGTLVEFKTTEWFGGGACRRSHARMFVVSHSRDCDGTPLYHLATKPIDRWLEGGGIDPELVFTSKLPRSQRSWDHTMLAHSFYKLELNIGEDSLTIVEITEDLKKGHGALEWDDQL